MLSFCRISECNSKSFGKFLGSFFNSENSLIILDKFAEPLILSIVRFLDEWEIQFTNVELARRNSIELALIIQATNGFESLSNIF